VNSRIPIATTVWESHHKVLDRSVYRLPSLFERRHEPLARSFSLLDFGKHDLEEKAKALGIWITDLGHLVTCRETGWNQLRLVGVNPCAGTATHLVVQS
jgi:hypothetical protein